MMEEPFLRQKKIHVLESGIKEIKMGVDAVVYQVIVAKLRVGNG